MKSSRVNFIGGCIVLAIIGFFGWGIYEGLLIRVDLNAKPESVPIIHVPAEATDVYSMRTGLGPADYFEFSLPERSFKLWAAERGWNLQEISREPNDPKRVHRPEQFVTKKYPGAPAWIQRGFHYEEWDPGEPDMGITVDYDAENERVYFTMNDR